MILSQFITFWSSASSPGRTLTAICTALELSTKSNNVALVDFDLRNPSVALYCNSQDSVHGIDNIFAFAAGKKLDVSIFESNAQKYGNLHYLRGTNNTQQAMKVDVKTMIYILDRLKDKYEYIVMDVNNEIDNAATYVALKNTDVIFDVIEKNIVKVQMYDKVRDLIYNEFDERKFIRILNKESGAIYMPDKDIEDYMGVKIHDRLPLLGMDLINAINQGRLLEYIENDKTYDRQFRPVIRNMINTCINNEFDTLQKVKTKEPLIKRMFGRDK